VIVLLDAAIVVTIVGDAVIVVVSEVGAAVGMGVDELIFNPGSMVAVVLSAIVGASLTLKKEDDGRIVGEDMLVVDVLGALARLT